MKYLIGLILISNAAMATMPITLEDREYQKFVQDTGGNTAIRVIVADPASGPSGGATAANQVSELTKLDSILTELSQKTEPTDTQPVSGTFWQSVQPISGAVSVSGSVSVSNFPSTQAVTGTFWQSTQPVSAVSLPLPAGAATSANQATANTTLTTINTTLGSPFQAGGSIGNTSFGISGTLPAFAATPTFNIGTLNGAATSANQVTGNASVASIDTKTPALGQALAAGSTPVVLTAAQLSTLTPLSSVSVSNFPSSQAVTGTFFQTTQPVSIATMPTTPVTGTFWPATQPVSGPLTDTQLRASAVSVSQGTSPWVVSGQSAVGTVPANNPVSVSGVDGGGLKKSFLLDTSGRLEINSAQSLPLPSGASTSANQTNGSQLSKVKGDTDGTLVGNVGDKLKVIDQSAITAINAVATAVSTSTGSSSQFKQNEITIATRTETDLPGVTYTVPAGKNLVLTGFNASYDVQSSLYLRLKKQTGGTGAFVTLFRMTLMIGGQGSGTASLYLGSGVLVGTPGDVFKVTYEATLAKGSLWAEFSWNEI